MPKVNSRPNPSIHLVLCLCILASLASAIPARAEVEGPAYTITVNSSADANTSNTVLTLREAMLLARGGTIMLGHSLSNAEKALTSGCTFNGSSGNWTSNAGCGSGYDDTIQFSASALGVGEIFVINSPLPAIADSGKTTIDGGTVLPFINASAIGAGAALTISSNNNLIKNIAVYAAPQDANILISGSSNTLQNVRSHSAAHEGMIITGSSNTILGAKIGISDFYTCMGNAWTGILIRDPASGASAGNLVKDSVIGCNSFGILDLSTGGHHIIGPGNSIGASPAGSNLANLASGVAISSSYNQLIGNTIRYNNLDGIGIQGNYNVVMTNTITTNGGSGILINGASTTNFIGCSYLCGSLGGNLLAGNGRYGLELHTTSPSAETHNNIVNANHIGFSADGLTAQPNALGGILIDAARDNFIGGAGLRGNYIGGNLRSGIIMDHGAYNNKLFNNRIGLSLTSSGDAMMPNGWRGIHLLNGAHDNTIGGTHTPSLGNMITYNGLDGIYLTGSGTANNTIDGNAIFGNEAAGIRMDASAHDNLAGSSAENYNLIGENKQSGIVLSSQANHNTIAYNQIGRVLNKIGAPGNSGYGVEITSGANNNTIGGTPTAPGGLMNDINSNFKAGVYLDGAATTLNTISNNIIGYNAAGVVISNTANANTLAGNYIGMQANLSILGNQTYGVCLTGGANNNIIGVTASGNRIANNFNTGVAILGADTAYNQVNHNLIYANQIGGVQVGDNAHHNTIGSFLVNANEIGGNLGYGALFHNGAHDNTFSYNNVGILEGSPAPNLAQGVLVVFGSHDNTFFDNTIANNTAQGVYLAGSGTTSNEFTLNFIHDNGLDGLLEGGLADGNWWSHVSMWGNGGMAIDKLGGNDQTNTANPPFPRVKTVTFANGLYTIKGTGSGSVLGAKSVKVEIYNVAVSLAGFAEGKTYLGEAYTLANGSWTITTAGPTTGCYVAFETVTITLTGVSTSSEFGRGTCGLFAPVMRR